MFDLEESLFHCKKLLALMEKDYLEIDKGLPGDVIQEYRKALAIEMDNLKRVIQRLQRQ